MDAFSAVPLALGIAAAGYFVGAGLRDGISKIAAALERGIDEGKAALGDAVEDSASAAKTIARINARSARYVVRMNRGFIRKRLPVAERTEAERLVDEFMEKSKKRLSEEERWELEWCYARLRGEDADQGSFSQAVATLRRKGAPLPDGITPEMIAKAIQEEMGADPYR